MEWIAEVPGRPHLTQRYFILADAKQRVRDLFGNSPLTGERYANSVLLIKITRDPTRISPADIANGDFDECFPTEEANANV